jgi:hypothetical protein
MPVKLTDKDRGLRRVFETIAALDGGRKVKVGVLADGAGGERPEGSDLTIAEIAAVQEFGTTNGHVPARSFLRATFDATREELVVLGAGLFSRVVFNGFPYDKALGILGLKLATDTKKAITSGPGIPPPLAPKTIAAKGSSRPLVDTGALVRAITWVIVGKGEE